MARYVKICPRCGRQNDELSEACAQDGEFLGIVPATPAVEVRDEPEASGPPPDEAAQTSAGNSGPCESAVTVTQRFEQPPQALYLETSTGQTYEIRHGHVLGQSHATSSAHVQIEDLPGVNFVHRSHCLFEFRENAWYVTAIAQPTYTNPTFVNRKRLEPGQSAPLHNGDRLILSNVVLNVRIIEL